MWKSFSSVCLLVHGILQARILEWVAIPSSRGSSQPRDRTQFSRIAGWFLNQLSHKGSPRKLEWVAYPFSSRPSQPGNLTGVSCIADGFFTNWGTREACTSSTYSQSVILHLRASASCGDLLGMQVLRLQEWLFLLSIETVQVCPGLRGLLGTKLLVLKVESSGQIGQVKTLTE